MKNLASVISNYISASTEEEALKYENKLLIDNIIPVLLVAAVFNAVFFIFFAVDYQQVIVNSVLMLALALLFSASSRIANENAKKYYIIVAFPLFLIFIVLRLYPLVGPTVWTVSSILIVISMGRNDRVLITTNAVVLTALGIYTWVIQPSYASNTAMYASQFFAFTILFIFAGVIQTIGFERYKKICFHLNEAKIISQISAELIVVDSRNIEDKVNRMLEVAGTYYNADRACIFILSADETYLTYTYEWCAHSIEAALGKVGVVPVSSDPWWAEQIATRNIWTTTNVDDLDPGLTLGKEELQSLGIKSFISVPIIVREEIRGFLIFEAVRQCRTWGDEQKRMLTVLANMLGDAYLKAENEREIKQLAYYDALTLLPNRFSFNKQLDEAILNAKINNAELAVIFIDLDSFKSVNDTMGHEGGDALLRQVSQSLLKQIRPQDVAARFGGDEFIILLTQFGKSGALKVISDNIMAMFNKPMLVNGQEFFVTASSGVAVYPYDGTERNVLIKNADLAMYTSKDMGKNQTTFCSAEMKAGIERKVQLTNMLYRAQERNELVLYYQPQICIATREIIGMEALIRWKHPERGLISPGVFIPLAEQSGLINPIGRWVLETACSQNKKWQDMGLQCLRMAVNLSVEQFRNPDLVTTIRDVLAQTFLAPEYLELEITESIAIREANYICSILGELKLLGVTISIDDFGTEYSSLLRIKQLPIDRIKMAMEFVHGISVSDKDEAIAKVIINLANNLGLKVIAEGVETENQLAFLENRVCDEVQGYYFYRPMPAEEIERILVRAKDKTTETDFSTPL